MHQQKGLLPDWTFKLTSVTKKNKNKKQGTKSKKAKNAILALNM